MPKIEVDIVGDAASLGRELRSSASQIKSFGSQTASSLDTAGKASDRVKGKLGGVGTVFKGALGANLVSAGVGAAVEGFRQLGGVLSESIGEARESQKVGATTAQIIKATGGAAGITADQIGDLSTRISNKTGVDDEAIQSGANLLLTFKQVRNEAGKGNQVFDRATQAASDLSAAGFGSITGSSKMLGKALNDPIKGISALGRAGVTFTAQQKDQIKTLTESGHTLEAQKIILGEVESQVGGVAAANATAGEKAAVLAGNLKEQLGTALLPALDGLAGFFTSTLGPAISKGIGFIGPALSKVGPLISSVVGVVGPIVAQLVTHFQAIGTAVSAAFSGGGGGGGLSAFITQLQPLGAVVAGILGTVSGVIMRVLPIVISVVQQIVGAFRDNLPAIQSAVSSVTSTISSIAAIITAVWKRIGPIVLPIITIVFGTAIKIISSALKIVAGIFKVISSVMKGDWSGAWDGIKQIASGAVGVVKAVVGGLKGILSVIWGGIKSAAVSAWNGIKSAASSAWQGIVTAVTTKVSSLVSAAKALPGKVVSALGNLGSLLLASGRSLVQGFADGIRNAVSIPVNAIKGVMSSVRDFLPFSPARKGPFAGRGWTLYSGRSIGASLAEGMGQQRRKVTAAGEALAAAAARPVALGSFGTAVDLADTRTGSAAAGAAAAAGAIDLDGLRAAVYEGARSGIESHLRTLDPRQEVALVRRADEFARSRGGKR